jgi:hypothetical protein
MLVHFSWHAAYVLLWAQGNQLFSACNASREPGQPPHLALLAVFFRLPSRYHLLSYRPPLLCLLCANETSNAWWIDYLHLFPHLQALPSEEARSGRCAGSDHAHPLALVLPGRYRVSVVRSGSFCSTTRCTTFGHSDVGMPYVGCFGPGRRCFIMGGWLPSGVASSLSRCCTLWYSTPVGISKR